MTTTVRTCQHCDTVVCVRDEGRYWDAELRSFAALMEDAGFWEADLVTVDLPIGNKRRGPCYLKCKCGED